MSVPTYIPVPQGTSWHSANIPWNKGYQTLKEELKQRPELSSLASSLRYHLDEFPERRCLSQACSYIVSELWADCWHAERKLAIQLAEANESRYLREDVNGFLCAIVAEEAIIESIFDTDDYDAFLKSLSDEQSSLDRCKNRIELCTEALRRHSPSPGQMRLLQEMLEHLSRPGSTFKSFYEATQSVHTSKALARSGDTTESQPSEAASKFNLQLRPAPVVQNKTSAPGQKVKEEGDDWELV